MTLFYILITESNIMRDKHLYDALYFGVFNYEVLYLLYLDMNLFLSLFIYQILYSLNC